MKSVEIKIREGSIAIIDLEDLDTFNSCGWHIESSGYLMRNVNPLFFHRIVLSYYGDLQVDHINQNKLDNRKSNLRICTQTQNSMNQPKKFGITRNQSNFKGVSWPRGKAKWRASITFNKKRHYLGWFKNEEDAARAYDKKAVELCKEFAQLNFPDEHI